MRTIWLLLMTALVFAGCGVEQTLETVADEVVLAAAAQPREIRLELPEEAALPAMESDSGVLYMCKDYDVTVQTLAGGDLQRTVREVSGCGIDELTLMQTVDGGCTRSEFVWTAAGETGAQVCRALVLDDGSYHYVLTASIDADKAWQYQEIWNGMFETFAVT